MSDADEIQTFHLPRFRAALAADRPKELPWDTYYRYRDGQLPKRLITLLLARPDLARALCDDLESAAREDAYAASSRRMPRHNRPTKSDKIAT